MIYRRAAWHGAREIMAAGAGKIVPGRASHLPGRPNLPDRGTREPRPGRAPVPEGARLAVPTSTNQRKQTIEYKICQILRENIIVIYRNRF